MKKSLLLSLSLIFLLSIGMSSCKNDDEGVEEILSVSDLPMPAQTFLTTYFSDYKAEKVVKDMEDNVVIYEVNLEGGFEIVFDSEGEWQQVDAPDRVSIPDIGFIPQSIQEYLNYNYYGYGVNEINRTGTGFKLELTNTDFDLYFNEAGEIIPAPGTTPEM